MHIPEIGLIKASAELRGNPHGKFLDQALSIFCPFFPALLLFDNDPTDIPVCLNHGNVNGMVHLAARMGENWSYPVFVDS
jgi:hypothetical protein